MMRFRGTALCVIVLVAGVSAQELAPQLVAKSAVTIQFKNTDLADALNMLQLASGITIQTGPEVNNAPPVTGIFRNSQFTDALALVLRSAGLSYKVIDAKTVAVVKPTK